MEVFLWVLAVACLIAAYLTWLGGRLDHLHSRTEALRASLDGQLVRRAAAAQAVGDRATHTGALAPAEARRLSAVGFTARASEVASREVDENALSRALRDVLPTRATRDSLAARDPGLDPLLRDLDVAATKVVLARRFYNDAVRDTLALRRNWLIRLFHLAGHASAPGYFEIDDTTPWVDSAMQGPAGL